MSEDYLTQAKLQELFNQSDISRQRLLYGEWLVETEQERKLRELAETYHTRCDFFDKGLLPYDGEDRGRMNANALRVRREVIAQGECMGFTARQVEEAIRKWVR